MAFQRSQSTPTQAVFRNQWTSKPLDLPPPRGPTLEEDEAEEKKRMEADFAAIVMFVPRHGAGIRYYKIDSFNSLGFKKEDVATIADPNKGGALRKLFIQQVQKTGRMMIENTATWMNYSLFVPMTVESREIDPY